MVKRVGVENEAATVCPSSTALERTTPEIGLVMVAYPRFVSAFFTFSREVLTCCCAWIYARRVCSKSLLLMRPLS